MGMRLPETWRTRDGRLLRIRAMSNDHLGNAASYLRSRGFISYREWRAMQPEVPHGVNGEMAAYYAEHGFSDEWERWLALKPHIALDAFANELAYRRRHGITVEDDGPSVSAERDGEKG
jgi:hypothetical protein